MRSVETIMGIITATQARRDIAEKLTGRPHAISTIEGINQVNKVIHDQHERTQPPFKPDEIAFMIGKGYPLFSRLSGAIRMEAFTGNISGALMHANHLYAYGEQAENERIAGAAFKCALTGHFALWEGLKRYVAPTNEAFATQAACVEPTIVDICKKDAKIEALELLRRTIHTAALEGQLGAEAKEHFDPHALGMK